jgi:hypothetical protein
MQISDGQYLYDTLHNASLDMAKHSSAPRNGTERALSEVIGFVLLLGLVVAAFSLWMLFVVPVNGREGEITQMNNVRDRFTDYKISLDSLWTGNLNGVTLSTTFNLGTGGGNTQAGGVFLPLLNPVGSAAALSVLDPGDTITISSSSPSGGSALTINMSVLQYQSQNHYFIQQKYTYQLGGVFLSQDNGSATRVSPPISIVNNSDLTNSVTIVPIRLSGGASIGGNGPVRVDSRLKTLQPAIGPEKKHWVNISVRVADYTTAQMWLAVFNGSRVNGGITNASWYRTGITPFGVKPATAYIRIIGPNDDTSSPDVWLKIIPVEYAVTLNNIASGLT